MIENPTNIVMSKSQTHGVPSPDQSVESIAVAGAAAIQYLITQRNGYYNRMNDQERELVTLNADNEDLRRRIALIRETYVGVARSILAQLEQLDQITREALGRTLPRDDAANVVAVAHRFKPRDTQSREHAEPANG
jgi:hypothetical protein